MVGEECKLNGKERETGERREESFLFWDYMSCFYLSVIVSRLLSLKVNLFLITFMCVLLCIALVSPGAQMRSLDLELQVLGF